MPNPKFCFGLLQFYSNHNFATKEACDEKEVVEEDEWLKMSNVFCTPLDIHYTMWRSSIQNEDIFHSNLGKFRVLVVRAVSYDLLVF